MKRTRRLVLSLAVVTAGAVYAPGLIAAAPTPGEVFSHWRDDTDSGREASAFWESLDDRYRQENSHSLKRALDQARRISPEDKAGGGLRTY